MPEEQLRIDVIPPDPSVQIEVTRLHRKRAVPRRPTTTGRPRRAYGPEKAPLAPSREDDPQLWSIYDELLHLDPQGIRTGFAIREALDQIYDGQRTGRWDWTQLSKTEKTHVGSLVEIWLQREFAFADGEDLDFAIADVDVDCKWSLNLYGWEIPMEMYSRGDKIALVVWGNDDTSRWAAGLIRISETVLLPMGNQRDRKRRLSPHGKQCILWLWAGRDLIPNALLHVDDPTKLEPIVYARSGQKAINALFTELQGQLVNRAAVLTAAQQVDGGRRVRSAREHLRPRGITIFGPYTAHADLATALGLERPSLGSFISARLARWAEGDAEPWAEIDGERWRLAGIDDQLANAPLLPEVRDA